MFARPGMFDDDDDDDALPPSGEPLRALRHACRCDKTPVARNNRPSLRARAAPGPNRTLSVSPMLLDTQAAPLWAGL